MQQIIPGVFHWTGENQSGSQVSSYWIEPAAAVIDPTMPEGGLDAFPGRPERVLLTSGHHLRSSQAFVDHFAIPIRALPQAVRHVGDAAVVEAVEPGQELAPGIVGVPVGSLSQDEGALHIAHGAGALALADAVNHNSEGLSFFPDRLLGDDPEAVKQGLREELARLATSYAFQALLFAHGTPIASGGPAVLERFTSFEGS